VCASPPRLTPPPPRARAQNPVLRAAAGAAAAAAAASTGANMSSYGIPMADLSSLLNQSAVLNAALQGAQARAGL
jgi:hypothetical protein